MDERPTLVMVDNACFVNSPHPTEQHRPCRVLYWNDVGQPYIQLLDVPNDQGMFATLWRPATTLEFISLKAQWENRCHIGDYD